ncbi:VanZ family protein [Geodermatophilus sp. YIM 151500]|uniref:VanZ family protein n=1 Tax=Geodermatophilus sp. YIM 151500 TaxID=2984531 RepID=UPI0021E3F886|nr:VanZ family protein [Geodermatophilus sp. YIM 151500]MCV2491962.1 VanZ family protein [Geodermatophilus sp. YIM 151500]
MPAALRVHGPLSRGVLAITVLVSLAVLFAPGGGVPPTPPGVDKVVHAALFAALAISGRWAGVGPRTAGVLLVLYAAVSEVGQALSPLERSGSVVDWLADLAGLLLGLAGWAACRWLAARRRRSFA